MVIGFMIKKGKLSDFNNIYKHGKKTFLSIFYLKVWNKSEESELNNTPGFNCGTPLLKKLRTENEDVIQSYIFSTVHGIYKECWTCHFLRCFHVIVNSDLIKAVPQFLKTYVKRWKLV